MGRTVKILDYQETAGNNYGQNCTNIKSLTRNSVRYSALCTVLLLVHYYSVCTCRPLPVCYSVLLNYSALSDVCFLSPILFILFCPLFCALCYSALSAILLCPLFCSVRYSVLSTLLFCPLFCYLCYSVLYNTLLCPPFCSVRYSVLSTLLFCPLLCSLCYSALLAILLCPLFCSVRYSALSAI